MKNILFYLFAIFAICSCNDSDDITEIFMNRTWKLSFFQEGTTRDNAKEGYDIKFYDNIFSVSTPTGAEISGNWSVDSESREFNCSNIKTSGNISNDATASKMETFLRKATHYGGDANWLQIKQTDKVYMQFHNK